MCLLLQLTICSQTLFAESRRAELKDQKHELQVSELTKVSDQPVCPITCTTDAALRLRLNADCRRGVEHAEL